VVGKIASKQNKNLAFNREVFVYSIEREEQIACIPVIVIVEVVGIEVPLVIVPVHVEHYHSCMPYHLYLWVTRVYTASLYFFWHLQCTSTAHLLYFYCMRYIKNYSCISRSRYNSEPNIILMLVSKFTTEKSSSVTHSI
jgi:hypothetical protein